MANKFVRIAFPACSLGTDKTDTTLFNVPGDYYPDHVGRSFSAKGNEFRVLREPAGLLHTHGVYMLERLAIRAGITPCENPKMPQTLRRD